MLVESITGAALPEGELTGYNCQTNFRLPKSICRLLAALSNKIRGQSALFETY